MRIPHICTVQTKEQVLHAFTQFSRRYESIETAYGHMIDVVTGDEAKILFLKRLGGAGADPQEGFMRHLIRAPDEFLELGQKEQKRLGDIAEEVAESPDVLLCHSDLIEALVNGEDFEDEQDPVAIAFHALIFQETTWTLTAMRGYADSFELAEQGMFVLVKDVNSTPLKQHARNTHDTSS